MLGIAGTDLVLPAVVLAILLMAAVAALISCGAMQCLALLLRLAEGSVPAAQNSH